MPYWFTRLVNLLLRDRHFRVHMGNDTSSWRSQRNGLPQGFVLAPVLFNLYTNDLPATQGRKFIYANDICQRIFQYFNIQYFSELECSLSSDMARMSHYCQKWRLKPSSSIVGVKMIRVFSGKPPRPNLAYQALQKKLYKDFLDFLTFS